MSNESIAQSIEAGNRVVGHAGVANGIDSDEDGVVGDPPPDQRLDRLRRFLMAVVADDLSAAEAEVASTATYSVSGHMELAGVFKGRRAILQHLEDVESSLSAAIDPLKWIDWLVGVDHVAILVEWHLQRQTRRLDGTVLFLASFDPDGLIRAIDVFLQDSPLFEAFFGDAPGSVGASE